MMTKERSTKILNILTPRQVSCDKAWPYKLYNEHDYLLLYQYANVLRDCGAVFLAIVEFYYDAHVTVKACQLFISPIFHATPIGKFNTGHVIPSMINTLFSEENKTLLYAMIHL